MGVILLLLVAGFALMFGATGFAAGLVRPLVGLLLVVSLAPALLNFCASASGSPSSSSPIFGGSLLGALLCVALAIIGFVAWKRRSTRTRREDAFRKRHGHPRQRALPPAPLHEDEE